MSHRIVCGVDASPAARDALSVAVDLAGALDLDLVLLHAIAPERGVAIGAGPYGYAREPARDLSLEAGRQLVERLAAELSLSRSVERRVDVGEPSRLVAEFADHEGAALIVVGTRGRAGLTSALLGSVSNAAVCRAACPVMVVPEGGRIRAGRPIICAVDDSPAARSATRAALWLSVRLGSELLIAHAIAPTAPPSASAAPGVSDRLAELERRDAARFLMSLAFEEGLDADVEGRLTYGSEAESIRELAEDEDAAIIAVGTRRRGSLRSALIGSVSLDLRSRASRPVLVVPAGTRIPIPG